MVQPSLAQGRGTQERRPASQGGVAGAAIERSVQQGRCLEGPPLLSFVMQGASKAVVRWISMGAYTCAVTSSNHYADAL